MIKSKTGSSSESDGADQEPGVVRSAGYSDFKQGFRDISFPSWRNRSFHLGQGQQEEDTFGHCWEWHLGEEQRSSDFSFQRALEKGAGEQLSPAPLRRRSSHT